MLGAFLDKLDQKPIDERARIPTIKINRNIAPVLHAHDEAADRTWALLRSLDGELFEISLKRNRQPYDPEYMGASLRFLETAEEICRSWLDRPRQQRYQEEWKAAIDAHAQAFVDGGASLRARPARIPGKDAQAVVAAFARIGTLPSGTLTLRQLSAQVFWGHSKVLDSREDLLRQLFPRLALAPRPLLVQVYLPQSCKGVLFIENQDTYMQALAGHPAESAGLALVYSAGFKGAAERIRSRAGVSLHYQGASNRELQALFERWWLDASPTDWPTWFWGDLDFSGMAILRALRSRFGDVHAWQPGYAPMLELLRADEGHEPDIADKAEQSDPGTTGCEYADRLLLPQMRLSGRFIDQEAV